jgi:hypothetical protein
LPQQRFVRLVHFRERNPGTAEARLKELGPTTLKEAIRDRTYDLRNSSGSLAMLAAMRRASSGRFQPPEMTNASQRLGVLNPDEY